MTWPQFRLMKFESAAARCDLEVNCQLESRRIFGFDDLPGFVLVRGLQAGAFAGDGVHAIKCSVAKALAHQAVTCLHIFFHANAIVKRAGPANSTSSGRVNADYAAVTEQ